MESIKSGLSDFVRSEAAGGFVLMMTAALAVFCASSELSEAYGKLLRYPVASLPGAPHTVHAWINDGLMSLFFLLVGLEIKREMAGGTLSGRQAILPAIAALGGMLAPAAIYLLLNARTDAARGWAIPTATDIAFALAALSLLGKRVPFALKMFLTAVAVFDDLGAVIVIAVFYSSGIEWVPLAAAVAVSSGILALGFIGTSRLWPYLALGALLWVAILLSGVHPTIAGVLLGILIPTERGTRPITVMPRLMHGLERWVALLIMPLFAFTNAGLDLRAMSLDQATGMLPLGILAGLVIGKPLGIFSACLIAVGAGIAPLPELTRWRDLMGIGMLAGIGFTMSLFIAGLAFGEHNGASHLGIIGASLVSGILGTIWLAVTLRTHSDESRDQIARSWPD